MAVFIVIPEGMEFAKKEKDVLIDKNGVKPDIMLQDIVQDYLRHVNTYKAEKTGLVIHNRKPPDTEDMFLKYKPGNNGAAPSEKAVKLVMGKDCQGGVNPAQYTTNGQLWHGDTFLSSTHKKKAEKRDAEVRDARRHIGESPKAT